MRSDLNAPGTLPIFWVQLAGQSVGRAGSRLKVSYITSRTAKRRPDSGCCCALSRTFVFYSHSLIAHDNAPYRQIIGTARIAAHSEADFASESVPAAFHLSNGD